MKLADIKSTLVEAYFTSKGNGASEADLPKYIEELAKLLSIDPLDPVLLEHEEPISAYRELSKGKHSCGYISSGDEILFVVVREGKNLACINLTAPTRVARRCTFRDVKVAFTEAVELDSETRFKTYFN